MANDIGRALTVFSGAITAQGHQTGVPNGAVPVTDSNALNEGLLGLAYDVGTAPMSYAKDKTDVPPVQALTSLPTE